MTQDEHFLKESEKLSLEVDLIRGEDINRDIEGTLGDKRLMDLYRTIATGEVSSGSLCGPISPFIFCRTLSLIFAVRILTLPDCF